jgi:hypothetical protein
VRASINTTTVLVGLGNAVEPAALTVAPALAGRLVETAALVGITSVAPAVGAVVEADTSVEAAVGTVALTTSVSVGTLVLAVVGLGVTVGGMETVVGTLGMTVSPTTARALWVAV